MQHPLRSYAIPSLYCIYSLRADVVGWFTKKLPSHSKETVQSWCPPVNFSSLETDFLVTLVAVGDLHLTLADDSTVEPQAATFVANISGVLRGADAVITNLACSVPDEEASNVEILRSALKFSKTLSNILATQ